MERILIAGGARKRSTHTGYQTRLLCPNGQQISFSLIHPVMEERHVDRICKRFEMSASTFKRLYDKTGPAFCPAADPA